MDLHVPEENNRKHLKAHNERNRDQQNLINRKHLKAHNERNRDKLFNVIKRQILKNYVLEKVNLQHFPLCGEFSRQL